LLKCTLSWNPPNFVPDLRHVSAAATCDVPAPMCKFLAKNKEIQVVSTRSIFSFKTRVTSCQQQRRPSFLTSPFRVDRRTHIPQSSNSTSVHTERPSVKGKHQRRILTWCTSSIVF
jgi:hypothetical protein